ncbi:hypothetical protein FHX81_5459 [Saccharothrix saharensis]|uniref:tRNA-guanine family transglycosylase n=2 Tax=Saccharothrix saharensis TaxID=571190 RepID=A0A543JJN7_9PSEU|nr:hypothetical protein FHX81_5459 [Saccharothrix saharensis]
MEAARAQALHALGLQPKPSAPPGPVGALTDRVLVHASWDAGRQLVDLLPTASSGLMLSGAEAATGVKVLSRRGHAGSRLIDPEGYRLAAATTDAPFVLQDGDGLFDMTLDMALDGQRDAGATAAITPTGFLPAGNADPLKKAADLVADLDRDDVILAMPLDIAWFNKEHFPQLLAISRQLVVPKLVFLGGQFDPMGRYKSGVANLRRLVSEAPYIGVARTDLNAFDAMTHGAFVASIGTGGSRRHVVPFGQMPISSKKDYSPSVLVPGLMSFYKGSVLAERFANAEPPKCFCPSCNGRALDTFLSRDHSAAAHAHGVHTWNSWISEMHQQRTLAERADWWQQRSVEAVAYCDVLNVRIEQEGAFEAPGPLKAWAGLPSWPVTSWTRQAPTH